MNTLQFEPREYPWLAPDLIPTVMRQRWWKRWQVVRFRHEVTDSTVTPEPAIKLELQLRDERGRHRSWVLCGVDCPLRDSDRLRRNLSNLARTRHRRRFLQVARYLHFDAQRGLLWQEGIDGENFADLARRGELDDAALSRAGAALAELHRQYIPDTIRVHDNQVFANLKRRLAELQMRWPECRRRCRLLMEVLRFRRQPTTRRVTLHGNLELDRLVLAGSQVAMLGLGQLRRGPAALDLGCWLAGVASRQFAATGALPETRLVRDPFVAGYLDTAESGPGRRAIEWYTALALVDLAARQADAARTGVFLDAAAAIGGNADRPD